MQVEKSPTTVQVSMTTANPTRWVKLYADDLFKFAVAKVADNGLAQDLVQETFLSALQALEQFRAESSEKTWLMAILKNKIIDHFRKSSKVPVTISIEEDKAGDSDPHHFFFNEKGHWRREMAPKAWVSGSSSQQDQVDFFTILRGCMNKLTSIGRKVFDLKYLEEKESADICKDLSISSSNYWVIIHRAKLQLRACLEKNWFSN
ncbi:sigma-70 family RNA polymerase sigma factor [Chitinophaga sp. 22321]|uniref:RNA polymerase sigma factor n=1 Tax=Chitinophaga hostae TaxID=2831022 RepID=A0ABS5J8N4_9BACT|nr:sigma-70 family RNA polymerase sigma factor [Chitinophaga hostae]MBS0031545.1 sigma-70 family RNA polymerase sigma factor [Chitinophaga hostae]